MKFNLKFHVRRAGVALPLAAALVAGLGNSTQAGTMPASGGVTFATSVTTLHHALPLFALHRTAAPQAFVAGAAAALKLRPLAMENTRLVSRDGQHVEHAYSDARTGEAQIFPDLSKSSGAAARSTVILGAANALFARADIIPSDATQHRLGDATPVYAASAAHGTAGQTEAVSAPQLLFTYVPAQRLAAGLPVYGRGSQATVGIGNDGSVRAFVRRWQAARQIGSVAPSTTSQQLSQAIVAQLAPLEKLYAITVEGIAPAYYDGDANYLQPVYAFDATLHPFGNAPSEHIRGYVPVGKLVEAIPTIGVSFRGSAPSAPHPGKTGNSFNSTSISLGQYANRDGSMEDMANAYVNGFDSVSPYSYGPPIDRLQWYWAYSFEVEASANSYLNAMQVAYTQPHGDWWLNTTDGTGGDPWYVTSIGVSGNPGFGAASGGQLATWIIDSCEVIPSYYDKTYGGGNGYNAFSPWWAVFQGLHRALGFRTEMLLGEDTMNYDIAQSMAEGAVADSAFYNGVAAVSFGTYADQHLGNMTVHYDRVSIMEDTRNEAESIYSVQGQSKSGQLHNTWMGN
ncbi:MAG: hypothetical protein IAI50_17415 [Candidatus Eremiobacteraeota bacterium]|nr:hypothetical protein [Candidatus Eremiobacteraeota bacterium]